MTTTIGADEAQQQLARLLELAKAGNEVIILEGTTPIARLTAVAPSAGANQSGANQSGANQSGANQSRVPGLHHGMASLSKDFDQPLPDDFWVGHS